LWWWEIYWWRLRRGVCGGRVILLLFTIVTIKPFDIFALHISGVVVSVMLTPPLGPGEYAPVQSSALRNTCKMGIGAEISPFTALSLRGPEEKGSVDAGPAPGTPLLSKYNRSH
jgi:hypothetical protein